MGGQLAREGPVLPAPAGYPRSIYRNIQPHIKALNDLWTGQMGRWAHPRRTANSGRRGLKQRWPSVTPSF